MPDDLDDLLRAAMKSLDDQVPSGYFEALPEQTLARLEAPGMQSTGHGSSQREAKAEKPAVPPVVKDEDSGLHDIRNLAQSTKQRLSSRRVSSTGTGEHDVLAQTSAGWKAVALPEPAKMVSLPALDELPTKSEVLAKEAAPPAASESAVATAIAARQPFNRPVQKKTGRTIALVGMGLAAAAGVAIYFVMANSSSDGASKSSANQVALDTSRPAATAAPAPDPAAAPGPGGGAAPVGAAEEKRADEGTMAGSGSAAASAGDDTGGQGSAEPAPPPAVDTPKQPPAKTSLHRGITKSLGKDKGGGRDKDATKESETKAPPPPPDKKPDGNKKGGKEDNEPSFDALLKQAGVDDKPKVVKPKLEKKELTGDDFKSGMSAIASRAQACYKGTQGTAKITVMVAPTGKVSSVSVTGQFAGKPEADCVSSAVKGASFPAWDGAPQRFTYVYLLSE